MTDEERFRQMGCLIASDEIDELDVFWELYGDPKMAGKRMED